MRRIVLAVLATAACGGDPVCDLAAATAAFAEGGTVDLGACRIDGDLVVPAGVTLRGLGPDQTTIAGSGVDPAVTLQAGAALVGVTVVSPGPVAVLGRGAGRFRLEGVRVEASLGVGIGFEDATSVELVDVQAQGPVNASNVNALPSGDVTPMQSASHGVVIVDVASAAFDRVSSAGFAEFGALIINSGLQWRGGGASDNRGVGIMVEGGTATLDGLSLCRTMRGIKLRPTYAGVFTNGATVTSTRLEVCDGDGDGLLHHRSTGLHVDLTAEDNGGAAVWTQASSGLEVSGRIAGNRFGGVVAVDARDVVLRDAQIIGTRSGVRFQEGRTTVEPGDGVQLVRSTAGARLQAVSLQGNERVGLLLELDAPVPSGLFDRVEVSATTADQLGAVAQGAMVPADWDTGVQRDAMTTAADAMFVGQLEIVGIVGPCFRPVADQLGATGLATLGF